MTIGAGDPGFPNWQMFTVAPAAYLPASVWTPFHFGFGEMHFSVDGTLVEEAPPSDEQPPSAVPEPATLALMLAGLVAGRRRLRALRA